jgi:hypothetical protein
MYIQFYNLDQEWHLFDIHSNQHYNFISFNICKSHFASPESKTFIVDEIIPCCND